MANKRWTIILVVLIISAQGKQFQPTSETKVKQLQPTSETNVVKKQERVAGVAVAATVVLTPVVIAFLTPIAEAAGKAVVNYITAKANAVSDWWSGLWRDQLSELSASKLQQITELQKKYQQSGKDISSCTEGPLELIKSNGTDRANIIRKCQTGKAERAANIMRNGLDNINASIAQMKQYQRDVEECVKLSSVPQAACAVSAYAKIANSLTVPKEAELANQKVLNYRKGFPSTLGTCEGTRGTAYNIELGLAVAEVIQCSIKKYPGTLSYWREYRVRHDVNVKSGAAESLPHTELAIFFIILLYLRA